MLSTNQNSLEIDAYTLSQVFEHIESAVIVASLDRKIVSLNQAARLLFGYDNQQLKGKSTKLLYANEADFIELGKKRFNSQANYNEESYSVDYLTASGLQLKGQTSSGLIKDSLGRTSHFVVIINDDSARLAAEETLNRLHSITSSRQLTFKQRVQAMLDLGAKHFGLPIGIFSKITGNQYVIKEAIHPENALEIGMTFELGNTYCSHVFNANDVEGFHHASQSHIATHPCFLNFGLEAYLGAPIFVDGERYGTLNFSSPSPTKAFIRQDIEIVRLFAEWVGHEIAREHDLKALENAHAQLEILANTDALTGLANRGCTDRFLHEQINVAHRLERELVVAILDFDHFKHVNDNYGHHVGDESLKAFASIIKQLARSQDLWGRWGGEEFLVIFPNGSIEGATTSIERVMTQLKAVKLSSEAQDLQLTMSAGVSSLRSDDTEKSLLARVDSLLYKAKENGRDQIQSDD
ncbi:sensor domain-containing diguanylate cyclase [Alginatibacterium sediminis]|uniref:diguanylate cyclase n=1 Tax=Alginatibacterium sediminis TaxID=2164068 RepID=A0A420EH35_9ALTE|nr:diguanylate cyclase [Alginatibacterium sediminis]RKF19978.1 sensor domain-containing diguanylate cyclase [Alginatibacterium sediminis]